MSVLLEGYKDYSTDTLETEMEYFTLIYKHRLKIHVQTYEILFKKNNKIVYLFWHLGMTTVL